MPLMDDVLRICQKYAGKGWGDYLKNNFGLDIRKSTTAELAVELNRNLSLASGFNLNKPGFEDIESNTIRGIERGEPSRSLLYHALANPGVRPSNNPNDYPTQADLEVLENYIFVASQNGASPPTIDEIKSRSLTLLGLPSNTIIRLETVVFAVEYRRANLTVHKKHADLCFSRTGIARVGTEVADYNKIERGYWPVVEGQPEQIRVLPARYATFLAVLVRGANLDNFGPLPMVHGQEDSGDDARDFWIPVHKLFSGNECINHLHLALNMKAHHVNEKIRRLHMLFERKGDIATHEPERSKKPYFFTDNIAAINNAINDSYIGLVEPSRHASLVEVAKDPANRDVSFVVPRVGVNNNIEIDLFGNSPTMEIHDRTQRGRAGPEYLHIRHDASGQDLNDIANLNTLEGQETILLRPGRRAFHYTDYTGDGWVSAVVTAQGASADILFFQNPLPAYSLVTAPDFYPAVNQHALMEWGRITGARWGQRFPNELSANRQPPNTELKFISSNPDQPVSSSTANARVVFSNDAGLATITAVVTLPKLNRLQNQFNNLPEVKRHYGLPDAAAGVFQPGWDISEDNGHLAAYGLGSPFPEDAKLCAALSGFWPAAAPDTSRTFINDGDPIVIPMADNEITKTPGGIPWDGVEGPTLSRDKTTITYPDSFFADYVINARDNLFSLSQTSKLTEQQYERRVQIMSDVKRFLSQPENARRLGRFQRDYDLLSFKQVGGLDSNNYRLEFATIVNKGSQRVEGNHRFFKSQIRQRFTLETGNGNQPQFVANDQPAAGVALAPSANRIF